MTDPPPPPDDDVRIVTRLVALRTIANVQAWRADARKLTEALDIADVLLADWDRLAEVIEQIRELHYPSPSRLGNDGTYCGHCGDEYPCQTVAILSPPPPTDGSTDDEGEFKPDVGHVTRGELQSMAHLTGGGIRSRDIHVEFEDDDGGTDAH